MWKKRKLNRKLISTHLKVFVLLWHAKAYALSRTHTYTQYPTHAKNGLKIKATVTAVETKWKWNEYLWVNRKTKILQENAIVLTNNRKKKVYLEYIHVLSLILTEEFYCKTDTQNPIVNMNRIERWRWWKNAAKIDLVREMFIRIHTHTHKHTYGKRTHWAGTTVHCLIQSYWNVDLLVTS